MKISLNDVWGQCQALVHLDLAKVAAVVIATVVAGVASAVAVAITVAIVIALALEIEAQHFYTGILQLHDQALPIVQPGAE